MPAAGEANVRNATNAKTMSRKMSRIRTLTRLAASYGLRPTFSQRAHSKGPLRLSIGPLLSIRKPEDQTDNCQIAQRKIQGFHKPISMEGLAQQSIVKDIQYKVR
jgi:hypothetical protein